MSKYLRDSSAGRYPTLMAKNTDLAFTWLPDSFWITKLLLILSVRTWCSCRRIYSRHWRWRHRRRREPAGATARPRTNWTIRVIIWPGGWARPRTCRIARRISWPSASKLFHSYTFTLLYILRFTNINCDHISLTFAPPFRSRISWMAPQCSAPLSFSFRGFTNCLILFAIFSFLLTDTGSL